VPAAKYTPKEKTLTDRQRAILDFIETETTERGYPPSVREIGQAVGLASPSTVHAHLATLQRRGYLHRDPTKPRAIEVRYDPNSGAGGHERRPVRHVPLVGDVAAGTDVLAQENVEEVYPVPADLTGDGELFMLRVRGDSMIDAGILDGDFVVTRAQPTAEQGDIVVAGIPGDEATVKTYFRRDGKVVLEPANDRLEPMAFDGDDVAIYGRVVTVMRRL
jgi:repressor LexA